MFYFPQELGWWSNLTFIFFQGVRIPPTSSYHLFVGCPMDAWHRHPGCQGQPSNLQPDATKASGEDVKFCDSLGECWLMLMVWLICFWNQDFLDASWCIYHLCSVCMRVLFLFPVLQGDLLRARVRPVDRQGTCRWRDRLDLSRDSRIASWHCRGSLWKWRSNASHLVKPGSWKSILIHVSVFVQWRSPRRGF